MYDDLLRLPATSPVLVSTRNNDYVLHRGKVSGGILAQPARYDRVARLERDRGMVLTYKGAVVLTTSSVVHAAPLAASRAAARPAPARDVHDGFTPGARVMARDRNNYGTIVGVRHADRTASVKFWNKTEGGVAVVRLPLSALELQG